MHVKFDTLVALVYVVTPFAAIAVVMHVMGVLVPVLTAVVEFVNALP